MGGWFQLKPTNPLWICWTSWCLFFVCFLKKVLKSSYQYQELSSDSRDRLNRYLITMDRIGVGEYCWILGPILIIIPNIIWSGKCTLKNFRAKLQHKSSKSVILALRLQVWMRTLLNTLRKQAYSNIQKILPLKHENFSDKKLILILFYISAENIDCGYSFEPPHWCGSNEYHNLCFWAEIRKNMYIPVNPSFTI